MSATLHPGEIVGVAGLAGSGRELIAGMITGRVPRRGSISVAGASIPSGQPKAALAAGMAWISGERARYGTFANLNLRCNLTMGDLNRHTNIGRIDVQSERAEVRDWIDRLGIVTRGPDVPDHQPVGRQPAEGARRPRAAACRRACWCSTIPPQASTSVLASRSTRSSRATPPTRCRCVLVSTDSDELARLCDRVLVMVRGVVTTELRRGVDLTAENIDHAQVAGATA